MEDIDGGLHPAVDGQSLDDEMMMISTCICATRRLSLCDIRKYRFPAFYSTSPAKPHLLLHTHDTNIRARRGNEDSRKNENRKSRKKFFSAENKFLSILCFLNSPSV